MADLERRIEQIKKMKYPNWRYQKIVTDPAKDGKHTHTRGTDPIMTMDSEFNRMGITISKNKVSVSIQTNTFSYRGDGNTIDSAIADALKKVQIATKKWPH